MSSYNEEIKLLRRREHLVYKSNALIQRSRFDLSLQEQKIILSLIQKILPDDYEFKLYDFTIKEFCELVGIDPTSGKNYSDIKNSLKSLADKSMWVTLPNDAETLVRWIEKPYIHRKSGTVKIKLDQDMMPYLLQLSEHFTRYSLYYVLTMKSRYSIRLYELFKSYENLSHFETTVENLKLQLFAEKYQTWGDFKKRVLAPAITEISNNTDITVSYTTVKQGKRIVKLLFDVVVKAGIQERLDVAAKIEQRLNPKEIKGQTMFKEVINENHFTNRQ